MRAGRDLRRLGQGPDRDRVVDALRALAAGGQNLDIVPPVGRAPWLRLRVGDWRVLFRPIDDALWIERLVHRRDLERAVDALE